MVYCIGHNIISPLGISSQTNFEAVQAGRSGLKRYADRFADVEPICASLFDTPQAFVPLCIKSVKEAVSCQHSAWGLKDKETIFILSTTKGDNLELLRPAQEIAAHFGNPNQPIVVSNACTSGVCAQITAMRLLEAGIYQHAVVIGCDIQTRFIVSGFQSFKALSPEPCLPFQPERKGLNLGEAAATIIYSNHQSPITNHQYWTLETGSIHNDANHISAPSRTGEGAYQCLTDVLNGCTPEQIALIGVHGTATQYNDSMEQTALERAGLQSVPKSVLKPYFGHTMGAAGVLETILCAMQVKESGVKSQESRVIKMLSGFGGVNAAIRLRIEN
ncbi:MAG: beta-ketoacyl synthase [Paludibacteraceae bacterium]|nr:beta-ketoacyl synthase [Paludibacteraceae bacterium]